MKYSNKQTFWVTNISPMNVTLADLALNIKAYTSVNLLDNKHYSYTLQQLEKSAVSGSLFAKKNKIVIRNTPPPIVKKEILVNQNTIASSKERSLYKIKEENYEELNISIEDQKKQDEEFAKINAELIDVNIK